MTRLLTLFGLLVAAGLAAGCPRRSAPPSPAAPASPLRLTRVTEEAGLRFQHHDGGSGRKYFPEVMGPGCAFVDCDGDGHPDVYLVNGAALPGAPAGMPFGSRFFRNKGDGTFTDATERAGLRDGRYAFGVCAGDYDNDGRLDLYVTHLDRNTLYRNVGNGVFRDVTERAGVGGGGFSTGAAFADYDGDGFLDLYVCRYVDWAVGRDVPCYASDRGQRVRVYCRPSVYPPLKDLLYHNNGDGTFSEVLARAGMDVAPGRALGCAWTDVDADGKPDLFVTNDMSANFLFLNQGQGRFKEEGLARGIAVGENGRPQASMGVAGVDYDGDGDLDLACTNFSGEYLALYRNAGGYFEDASAASRLLDATSPYVGFGLLFPDLDLDGRPDLFVANGHVTEAAERFYPGVSFAQPSLCLRNEGGTFRNLPDAGEEMKSPRVSRGAAAADYNGDGAPDLLVANWRGTPDLLRNDSPRRGHWLRLRLEGTRANRSAIGARVEVACGGRAQVQEVRSGGSYCSQGELALTFGLGESGTAERVTVRWPGGAQDIWENLPPDREHRLRQR